MHYDVVVIGAGPAGLSFARSLGNSDLRVLVVEKPLRPVYVNRLKMAGKLP